MDDIVDRLRDMAWRAEEGAPYADALREAADEIARLRVAVQRQGMRLLIAHSEALGLYELDTTVFPSILKPEQTDLSDG